jgi:alpha-beta hydrolase superfamily lysophospholipase
MPEQTHLSRRFLKGTEKPDKDVQALFAITPVRKAILFIHGFHGDAIKTWSDFHLLLPECEKCIGQDIYFYGYDGLRAEMTASAAMFRDFLDRLFIRTSTMINESLPSTAKRADDFSYDELVIVAHSLGAVIARRALLDATKSEKSWVLKIKLVLYAPAHCGASVAKLALEASSSLPFIKYFAPLARLKSPLIDQLTPGSPDLTRLLDETLNACKNGNNPHLVACKVVIAEYEEIVRNDSFGNDPPPVAIPETYHTTVCKPKVEFRKPLDHLEECL